MERLFNEACDPKQLSPLTLAFVGDAAFELFVRERLVCLANCPVKKLHQNAVAQVRCQAQAKFMELLMPILTEEEIAVFKEEEMPILLFQKMRNLPITTQPQDLKRCLVIYI